MLSYCSGLAIVWLHLVVAAHKIYFVVWYVSMRGCLCKAFLVDFFCKFLSPLSVYRLHRYSCLITL